MQRKLIVVVVGLKKWNRTFGLEPIPSVKTGLPFKTFQHFRKFLTGTSGARGRPINLKINQIAFRVNRVRPIRFESLESVKGQDTEIRIGAMIAQCTMHRS